VRRTQNTRDRREELLDNRSAERSRLRRAPGSSLWNDTVLSRPLQLPSRQHPAACVVEVVLTERSPLDELVGVEVRAHETVGCVCRTKEVMTDFMCQRAPERKREQELCESRRYADQLHAIHMNRFDVPSDVCHPEMRNAGVTDPIGWGQAAEHELASIRIWHDRMRMLLEHDDEVRHWTRQRFAG